MWTSSSSSSSAISRSLSSSTSSSSPSPYTTTTENPGLPKTMEEVWKDITLAAADLHHHNHHHAHHHAHHHPSTRGMILQDFFSKDPPPHAVSSSGFSASPPPPPPLPPTMLTLSSGPDHFGSLLLQPQHQMQPISHVNVAFDAVVPNGNAGGGKKRFADFDRSSGDRRHKRMIKNRESAARSRARKQAYTNELELEVAHLLEENARLKKQHEQFYRAAAAEHQKRKPLHRTSTAPF